MGLQVVTRRGAPQQRQRMAAQRQANRRVVVNDLLALQCGRQFQEILVARRILQYLNATDPFAKTIVFCEDIDHMRRRVEDFNEPELASTPFFVPESERS